MYTSLTDHSPIQQFYEYYHTHVHIHGNDCNAPQQLVGFDRLKNRGDVLHQAGVQQPLAAGFTIGHTP